MSGHYEHFGKYILLEKLATGGMAEVFLARGSGAGGIGKFFAIKRILPQYADSPEFIEMFKDEAKIAINLNHSNIVSIHEFGVEKGQFFLVMDYVEGRNLRQILNKMKKTGAQFTIEQIVFIIKEVGAGLDHAHRCIDGTTGKPLNITHRDMSPQNVMVSFEGEVKIVDFGIAKAESQIESTRAGTLKGKFGYMSPEQAEGQPVDLRTDIFSLGIVLWELLAHDRLFVANNEINTLRKIRDCQIPSLRKINPNIHTELERIVQKALARDRNLRYQTGAALHRDLNRFLNRQFPDFSAQDFSVFVKNVFADEILALRKRLVEYAKVNLTVNLDLSRRAANDPDDTNLLESNTNSEVSEGASDVQSRSDIGHDLSSTDLVSSTGSPPPKPVSREDDSLVTASADSGPSLQVSMPSLQINPEVTSTETEALRNTQATQPINPKAAAPALPGVLDESALQNALSVREHTNPRIQPIEIKPNDVLQAADLNVPRTPEPMSAPRPAPQRIVQTRPSQARPKKESRSHMRVATVVVFFFLCLSVYAYLVKYFAPMMGPVVSVTDPYLGWLHAAIGVQPSPILSDPPVDPCIENPSASGCIAKPGPADLPVTPRSLVVTSNPSGADIIVNEQPTGKTTPQRIEVDGTFSIRIKKKGYAEFNVTDATRESLGHRLDATLQKLNIAYLDVEIFPPQPANLYINGKQYPIRRTSVREIPIPGGTPIKVRAEALRGNTFEELIVSVPTDKRKVVQLNPRKTQKGPRDPAGKDGLQP